MKALWREPLLHFLVLGAGLFWVYGALNRASSEADPQTIVVDRQRLLSFVQYRSRAFEPARFNERLDSLSQPELQRLVQEYVREEALYREAKALQLDRNDYVARQRLIQQLEFITGGIAEPPEKLSEKELQRYYAAHKERYRVPPQVTFTHVFFSEARGGAARAEARARAELRKLNAGRVRFDQAPSYGDRFLYHLNYVDCEAEQVSSHFGTPMQAQVFALQPSDRLWRGPFQSPYGFHLVLLTRNEPWYLPPLKDIRGEVEQDARQAARDVRLEASLQSIVKAYKVKVEPIRTDQPSPDKAPS